MRNFAGKIKVGTKIAKGKPILKFFIASFVVVAMLVGCQPISQNGGSGYNGGAPSGGYDDGGNPPPSLEREIAGNYSDGNYLITLKSNKNGEIIKVDESNPSIRSASGNILPTGNLTWSASGTAVTIIISSETLSAKYSSSGETKTLTIGNVVYTQLPSMDDTEYTPPSDVPVSGNYSATIKDNAFFGSVMHPAIKGGEAVNVPLKFVIVSDAQFKDTLQGYINHKRKQGFNVVEIYRAHGESAEQLRQKIIDEHYTDATAENPAPAYVLLCGDSENLPPFNAKTLDLGKQYFTDYHYGEYNDDWTQEAMVGRFSAKDVGELEAQINKTIYMETHGGTNEYLSVGMKDADQSQWVSDYVRDAHATGGLVDWLPVSTIVSRINSGVGFVFHAGHSGETYWTGKGGYYTSLDTVEARKLSNTNQYPVFMSMSCYSATFAYPYGDCLGEALMKNSGGGAVGYIGATITSKAAINPMVSQGWRYWDVGKNQETYTPDSLGAVAALYHSRDESKKYWARSMGEVLYSGMKAIELQYKDGAKGYLARRYHEIYVLLGDPTYMPYTKIASQASITCGIAYTGRALEITTAPFARLALTKEIDGKVEIIAVTVSDEFGRAVMKVPKNAPVGDAVISSIAQNYYMKTQSISIEENLLPEDNDATLKKLSVEKANSLVEEIGLENEKFNYKYVVPYEVNTVIVYADANKNTSAVYGTGTVHLEIGENDVEIEVIAEDMTKQTYNLKIVRNDTTKSRDDRLKSLKIDGKEMVSPSIEYQYWYDIQVPADKANINVVALANSSKATVTLKVLDEEVGNSIALPSASDSRFNSYPFYFSISVVVQPEFTELPTTTYTIRVYKNDKR